jgi:hypothetical protein
MTAVNIPGRFRQILVTTTAMWNRERRGGAS